MGKYQNSPCKNIYKLSHAVRKHSIFKLKGHIPLHSCRQWKQWNVAELKVARTGNTMTSAAQLSANQRLGRSELDE